MHSLNGVGTLVTFDFLFFPHLTDYMSVIFFPSLGAFKDHVGIWAVPL